ncbi:MULTISPECIES: transcriptional regulator [unclassified Bradyrhizobium]|uniref:transcriptional regulator n=1 Tax=unclassified Bradyrhizobium TaxID=2631580 RepID=UPI0020B296B7|nr:MULTISPECIES: transcriptional regulator [unclassified Bradyrhizobium]MCP3385569.1 transcriptional regulator [Bradyrhizobium sp. CCGUVB4N]MCP3446835.1 transcriptional regulator [Bradyrhizobium sp. CCGUVB14]
MSARKSAVPSPEAIARADRQRLAVEEGVRAIADAERQAIKVRKNMARLRELREAKEAADAAVAVTLAAPIPKKRTRRLLG